MNAASGSKKKRALEFFEKAQRVLRQINISFSAMRQHGENNDLEALESFFSASLAFIDSLHQALADSASKAGEKQWAAQLQDDREHDELLRYLWKARNSELHDTLIKWDFDAARGGFTVIDPARAQAISNSANPRRQLLNILRYAYGAASRTDTINLIRKGVLPSTDRLREAGMQSAGFWRSLRLMDFTLPAHGKSGSETIAAPSQHMGKPFPPTADVALETAIAYYTQKVAELGALLSDQ